MVSDIDQLGRDTTKNNNPSFNEEKSKKILDSLAEIKKLQKYDFCIYGLAREGKKDVYDLENETGHVALILGSEGKGLRRLTKDSVDCLIKIPINEESNSLNVSNAASIAMFQLQKNVIKN